MSASFLFLVGNPRTGKIGPRNIFHLSSSTLVQRNIFASSPGENLAASLWIAPLKTNSSAIFMGVGPLK